MASRVLLYAAVIGGAGPAQCPSSLDTGCPFAGPEPDPSVMVARHDIAPGHTLDIDDLAPQAVPRLPDAQGIERAEVLVGRVARERLLAGEPVRLARLAPIDAGVGLMGVVPPGMVPLRIQGRPADTDTVTAGVYVDLLVTDRDRAVTRTALSGVEVIAVIPADPHCDVGPTVVLAATPDLAARVGDLLAHAAPTFVLRSDLDFVTPPSR